MPRKSDIAKTYCTLREAFDLVGTSTYGPKWRGFEADCDPARAAQPTDTVTLLRKLAPDGQSFSTKEKDRRPVPKRPVDGIHRVRFGQAIGRHMKALKELLHFLHSRTVPAEFIPENATTAREDIPASDWPDPEKFNPKKPTWGDLRFDVAADRVVRNFPKTSPVPGRVHGDGSLWWAYAGRAGHVEIDREALERALRPHQQPKKPPPPTTAGAETRCKEWLIDLMKAGPRKKGKDDYQKEAEKQFNVGTRAFIRAWMNAVAETGNKDWSKPGPRS